MKTLAGIVNLVEHPLSDVSFQEECKRSFNLEGALVLNNFLTPESINSIRIDGEENQSRAYYTSKQHNVYLTDHDQSFADQHPRNRLVTSSKGCITTDQLPETSALHSLYKSIEFKQFLCSVLAEKELFEYADTMSSINIHYASAGQELGWHFDNSSFAITLMIQPAKSGGVFEYVKDIRNTVNNELNYLEVERVLNNEVETQSLNMPAGTLVLFRGHNSIHRVTPTMGDSTRMLVVLAYNTEPDIALSESARLTFYGRLK